LLCDTRIIAGAIQANPQIRAAFHARFATPRLAVQFPFLAAIVTVPRHLNLRFVIYDLRFGKQYPRQLYFVNQNCRASK
jgi:hypothetical protein